MPDLDLVRGAGAAGSLGSPHSLSGAWRAEREDVDTAMVEARLLLSRACEAAVRIRRRERERGCTSPSAVEARNCMDASVTGASTRNEVDPEGDMEMVEERGRDPVRAPRETPRLRFRFRLSAKVWTTADETRSWFRFSPNSISESLLFPSPSSSSTIS